MQDFIVYPPLGSHAMLYDIHVRSHVESISIKGNQHVRGLN